MATCTVNSALSPCVLLNPLAGCLSDDLQQILDALIGNAGVRFQRSFADEPLLERLRIAATDTMTDPDVKAKLKVIFGQWAVAYKDTPGLTSIASLYKQLPQRRRPRPAPQVLRETSPEHDKEPSSPHDHKPGNSYASPSSPKSPPKSSPITIGPSADLSIGHKSHKKSASKSKNKSPPFSLEKEKPAMLQSLANASVASTNLKNALKLINREKERPSGNPEVLKRFETCKQLRRSILRYIQHVESEQWLGGLIHANEELVEALTLYEVLDKPIEEDSDSEDEGWNDPLDQSVGHVSQGLRKMKMHEAAEGDRPHMPPRPGMAKGKQRGYESEEEEQEEEDPDDPFGDNQYRIVDTPGVEKEGVTW